MRKLLLLMLGGMFAASVLLMGCEKKAEAPKPAAVVQPAPEPAPAPAPPPAPTPPPAPSKPAKR